MFEWGNIPHCYSYPAAFQLRSSCCLAVARRPLSPAQYAIANTVMGCGSDGAGGGLELFVKLNMGWEM